MVRNQLLMYTEALSDVQTYVNVAMVSDNYVEPAPNASAYIIYRRLFEDLKSPSSYLINTIWSDHVFYSFPHLHFFTEFYTSFGQQQQRRTNDSGPYHVSELYVLVKATNRWTTIPSTV